MRRPRPSSECPRGPLLCSLSSSGPAAVPAAACRSVARRWFACRPLPDVCLLPARLSNSFPGLSSSVVRVGDEIYARGPEPRRKRGRAFYGQFPAAAPPADRSMQRQRAREEKSFFLPSFPLSVFRRQRSPPPPPVPLPPQSPCLSAQSRFASRIPESPDPRRESGSWTNARSRPPDSRPISVFLSPAAKLVSLGNEKKRKHGAPIRSENGF